MAFYKLTWLLHLIDCGEDWEYVICLCTRDVLLIRSAYFCTHFAFLFVFAIVFMSPCRTFQSAIDFMGIAHIEFLHRRALGDERYTDKKKGIWYISHILLGWQLSYCTFLRQWPLIRFPVWWNAGNRESFPCDSYPYGRCRKLLHACIIFRPYCKWWEKRSQ